MTSFIRLAAITAITAVAVQLTGCANMAMTAPQPTIDNATKLRAANMAPVAIGAFKIDPAKARDDKEMNMRGSNGVHAPSGSFAQYLGDSLKVELQSAGLLDAASGTVITGTLTQTELDAAIGTGKAKLGARFVVTRSNAVAYDRELTVDSEWESSFMGAVAIPLAAQNYEGLYRKLVSKLFDDAAFKAAVAKQ
jgi:hypothetical protein